MRLFKFSVAVVLAISSIGAAQTPVLITANQIIGYEATTITPTAGGSPIPLSMAQITVQGARLTINGRHAIDALIVKRDPNNQGIPAVVTHTQGASFDYSGGSGTDVVEGLYLIVTHDLLVEGASGIGVASRIDTSGCGFAGSQGPGQGGAGPGYNGGGGAYGGAGSDAAGSSQAYATPGIGGFCYGFEATNLFSPTRLGSGGGNSYSGATPNLNSGGFGGGSVHLEVGGTLTINGQVIANGSGGASGGLNAGGGSGGSIFLSCAALAGSGSLQVNGGTGGTACCNGAGGGGGGGRIAVVSAVDNSSLTLSASGNVGNGRGGAGTIFTKTIAAPRGTLLIDNGNNPGETTEMYGPIVLDANVVVRNGGVLGPAHGQGGPSGTGSDRFDVSITGDMTIISNGAVSAYGRGLSGSAGNGAGGSADNRNGGGAGYGGAGSDGAGSSHAYQFQGLGGMCYGFDATNLFAPTLLGSGGGSTYSGGNPDLNTGGFGGGSIRLNVAGQLTVEDQINAGGANGVSGGRNAGGGSGGSINITCGSLMGAGSISANGGDGGSACCNGAGGAGGGGRISIRYNTFSQTVAFRASGGTGNGRGGAGTIYTKSTAAPRGTLIIDNGNNPGETTEFYGPVVLDCDVLIQNQGNLGPAHGQGGASGTGPDRFDVSVTGNMTIGTTGFVSADGRGLVGSLGVGQGGSADGRNGGGGGYGGVGGAGSPFTSGGGIYGLPHNPTELGSGGGNTYVGGSPNRDTGGFGGGSIRLNVVGTLTVAGKVSADGANGAPGGLNAGGGSGGSVSIVCGSLAGTGYISADGGDGGTACCNGAGGGGGGGRVAVFTCSLGGVVVRANGGAGAQNGTPGSTWIVPPCYANCDCSSAPPVLNANDFNCFLNKYAAGITSYVNCDESSAVPLLNANDFLCYLNKYAAGCP